jgi:hypothetical protein
MIDSCYRVIQKFSSKVAEYANINSCKLKGIFFAQKPGVSRAHMHVTELKTNQ